MRIICFMVFVFLSISCEKTNKKSSVEENLIKKNTSPVFMSLSPNMTNKEFVDEINSLNISEKLNDGIFTVKVKDEEFYFRVNKVKSSISLNTDKRTNFIYTNYNEYERQKEEWYSKIKDFVEKIEEKYKKNESLTNIFFEDWNLERGDFGAYRDSSKTVTIQYNLEYSEYYTEQYIKDNYKNFYTDENGRIVRSSIVIATINISYYYNEDFDKLLEKKKHNKVISERNKRDKLNIKAEKEKVLENNLNNF